MFVNQIFKKSVLQKFGERKNDALNHAETQVMNIPGVV